MKVLNLHTCPNGLFTGSRPNGGLEMVVLDLHSLLRSVSVDCRTICSMTDYCAGWMRHLPINPNTADDWKKEWAVWSAKILRMIEDEKPDVIMVHGSGKLLRMLNKHGHPVFYVDHQGYPSVNKLYHEDYYTNTYERNRDLGGVFYGVGVNGNEQKELKIREQGISDTFKFDGAMIFQYVSDELLSRDYIPEHNHKAITIGRAENDKAPHKIDQLRRKKVINDYTLITMLPGNKKKQVEYWTKNIECRPEILQRTLVGLSRGETLDRLQQSMVYASTMSGEWTGISTFEAGCLGVPFIMWEPPHGKESPADPRYKYRYEFWTYHNDENLAGFVQHAGDYLVRKRLQEFMRDTYSKNKIANAMVRQLAAYVEQKKPVKSGLDAWF